MQSNKCALMIELAAQVVFGTVLYIAVLWEARRNPRAAGTMLTFPTLNGISMLITDPAELEQVVGTMLLIPIANGLSCVAYLATFDLIFRPNLSPAKVSWLVLIAVASIWIVLAWQITLNVWSVPVQDRIIYMAMVMLAGLIATLAFPAHRPRAFVASRSEPLEHLLRRNWRRIVLFAIALSSVVAADGLQLSAAFLGVLAAVPLVPFFSLHTIAADSELTPAARREGLAALANGVWLGPPIAIGFIIAFSEWLGMLAHLTKGTNYIFLGASSLLAGWGFCIFAIWGCEKLLRPVSSQSN